MSRLRVSTLYPCLVKTTSWVPGVMLSIVKGVVQAALDLPSNSTKAPSGYEVKRMSTLAALCAEATFSTTPFLALVGPGFFGSLLAAFASSSGALVCGTATGAAWLVEGVVGGVAEVAAGAATEVCEVS